MSTEKKKHHRFTDRTGEKHYTKQGYLLEIICYRNCNDLDVKLDNIIIYNKTYSSVILKEIQNPFHPNMNGVGYVGIGTYRMTEDGKHTKYYQCWSDMFTRGYSNKYKERHPSYKDVTVCEEWYNFQNFAKWFEQNYIEGFELDKDILVKGNKVYSPETCCFLPHEVNSLIIKCDRKRGTYPLGVSRVRDKFLANFTKNMKRTNIGTFDTVGEAFQAYKTEKEKYIKEVADKWKDKIDPRVYQALIIYKIEIID